MKTVTLGRTGAVVSRISLGGYPFGGINEARGWNPWEPDCRRTAIETIHRALDRGITMIDTAPGYGNRHSERIIGEVMKTRRAGCFLATKCPWKGVGQRDVIESVERSLRVLHTETLDLVQFHGGAYAEEDVRHVLEGGPLDALRALRDAGKVRFIGVTSEEPWTLLPFVRSGAFDVVQVRYNLIHLSAAHHLLNEARERNVGVITMRSLTSGIFQRLVQRLVPEWQAARDVSEVALKFVLSDSRVHVANVGMRWPDEVERNVQIVESYDADFDMADFPLGTRAVYDAEDAEAEGT